MWDNEEIRLRNKVSTGTICEANNYRIPEEYTGICHKLLNDEGYKTKHPILATNDGNEQDIFHGLARLEIVKRDPSRKDEVLFRNDEKPFDPKEYWTGLAEHSLDHLRFLWDTADFHANYLLRLIYLYGETPGYLGDPPWRQRDIVDKALEETPAEKQKRLDINENFSPDVANDIKKKLLTFKYWLDEPFFTEFSSEFPFPYHGLVMPINGKLADARKQKRNEDNYEYDMVYWSENHQILFATAEYLAGQMWPEYTFQAGKEYRDEYVRNTTIPYANDISKPLRTGDMTGKQHMEKAKPRIMKWLNDRLRFGFSEWNSPVYYEEDLIPLFNLADFCKDKEIQTRACMVLDLIFFDLARFTNRGSFAVTSGRAYADNKTCGFSQAVGDLIEILFGTRNGSFAVSSSKAALSFISSTGYKVPDVLVAIGQDVPRQFFDRSRVSVNFDEMADYGINLESEEGVIFWWGKGAFVNDEIRGLSKEMAEKYRLMHTDPFSKVFLPGTVGKVISYGSKIAAAASIMNPVMSLALFHLGDKIEEMIKTATDGSTLSRANLCCYRNNDVMLSSVQNFRPGQLNFQSHSCQATLSLNASVWTTHPQAINIFDDDAAKYDSWYLGVLKINPESNKPLVNIWFLEFCENFLEEPTWWQGSLTLPRVVQMNNAAIIAYKLEALQLRFFHHRTHAWFPKHAFDQNVDNLDENLEDPTYESSSSPNNSGSFVTPMPNVKKGLSVIPSYTPVSANCNIPSGKWIFGKVGDGYVALFSAQEPKWSTSGEWKDKEIMAEGARNIFIIQVGNKEEYGSYENFKLKVSMARIHIHGLSWEYSDFECDYDIPRTKQRIKEIGPGSDRLELQYDYEVDQVRLNGQPFDDSNFPRFENQYIKGGRVLWGQYHYTIKHKGYSLTHDFRALNDPSNEFGTVWRDVDSIEHSPTLIEKINCTPQGSIEGRGTSSSPSMAVAGHADFTASYYKLFMAWKGAEDDPGIYWSQFDGSAWSSQEKIQDVGSSHGPALNSYEHTGSSSRLFMAWKGAGDDEGIWFSTYQGNNNWAPQQKIQGIGSNAGPSLAVFNNRLFMAWKGAGDDEGIWFSTYQGNNNWAPQQKIQGVGTSDTPALVVADSKLHIFWKGAGDDVHIYHSWLENLTIGKWHDQEVVSCLKPGGRNSLKIGSSNGPRAVSVNDAILLTWKGIPDDSGIYFLTFHNNEWKGQVRIKGIGSSSSPTVADFNDEIFMAWKGVEDDQGIYYAILSDKSRKATGIYFSWP